MAAIGNPPLPKLAIMAAEVAMDRFDAMRVFLTVADVGGFAAAARRLRRSPPAVTRLISALEGRLGARLLSRTTRVVRLTEAGERFAGDARRILAELEEAEAHAAGSHRELRGGLRITAPMMFGKLHVAPIALELLARHPEISVRALYADRVVELAEEGIDVAVRIAELADSSARAVRVGAVRTVLCAAPSYLRKRRRAPLAHPRQLAGHETIAFHPALGEPRWSFFDGGKRLELAPPARLVASSTEVMLDAALAGAGILRSLSYLVAPALRAGALRLLLVEYEPPPTPVHVVIPEGRQAAARVRVFAELAAERLRAALAPGGPAAVEPIAENDAGLALAARPVGRSAKDRAATPTRAAARSRGPRDRR
jgi:DNA-binding transcriptional LysR family regulator